MMRVVDDDFLDWVRRQPCAACGRAAPSEPHHVFCRGAGGGSRLDVPVNVLPLCGGIAGCHGRYQEGKLEREMCWRLLDHRLGLEPGQAEAAVHSLLRRKKA